MLVLFELFLFCLTRSHRASVYRLITIDIQTKHVHLFCCFCSFALQLTDGGAVMRASTALISPVGKLNDECRTNGQTFRLGQYSQCCCCCCCFTQTTTTTYSYSLFPTPVILDTCYPITRTFSLLFSL